MRTPHYLPPLLATIIPPSHAIFDTETRAERKHGRLAHRWVCGAVSHGELDSHGAWGHERPSVHNSPEHMWAEICDHHVYRDHLVIWAHNLSFDLRVSEALRWLPVEGYALEAIVLEKTAAWASFTGEQGKLTICDLHSWLPVPLHKLANDLGAARRTFKYEQASDTDLEARCSEDVEIASYAIGHLLEFLQAENAGRFRPTGSGQSHSMWRRRFLPSKTVLIHGDESALERERVAMWAGRAEAWTWGKVDRPLYEHDLNLAYCRIAATHNVPVKLYARTGRISVQQYRASVQGGAILADVTVNTESEIVPTGVDGRMFWPVGEFQTTLWNPELDALIQCGADVTFHRTWRYKTAPVLQPMAEYLINLLELEDGSVHPVVKRLLKHWARTLVGRCALRYREWDDYGSVGVMGLSLSTMYDLDDGTATSLLHVGQRIMELTDMAEAESSVPQITGWVMSQARANLWYIMLTAGLDNLDYVDTDCVIVNSEGHGALLDDPFHSPSNLLVHKATYSKARIYGPRNIVLEGERRLSGVPKRAVRTGELSFDGEVWAGLRSSLESSRPNQVAVAPRSFDVEDVDPRRVRTLNGNTRPFRRTANETT